MKIRYTGNTYRIYENFSIVVEEKMFKSSKL